MLQIALNEEQKKAVEHVKGPMMVLAGPGSGKTMVITHRVQYLITDAKIDPKKILVITFTKAAADEMKNRFNKMNQGEMAQGKVTFGTFHSIFFRILRSVYGFTVENIIKEEHKYQVFKQIITTLKMECEDEQELINAIISEISLMKNELIAPKYYNPLSCGAEEFNKVVTLYETYKKEKKLIDFDDMLTLCYNVFLENKKALNYWQQRFQFILVDEFQDINRVQYEIIKLLSEKNRNLFIVGDDDQSIYRFRGARPEFLLNFPKDFEGCQSVILDVNYRSTKEIVSFSKEVIKNNEERYKKNIHTTNAQGAKPKILRVKDTDEESSTIANQIQDLNKKGIAYCEMAVIFRTNLQARAMVDIFLDMNLPFVLRDQAPSIYTHWIAKDILAYLKLCLDKKDNEQAIRIINKPKRYISKYLVQDTKTTHKNFLIGLMHHQDIKKWQLNRLEELDFGLDMMKQKKPYEAIKYIRNIIGYDEYLCEYATFRKIGIKGLNEVLDELQDSAKKYQNIASWIAHIEQVSKEIKEKNNGFKRGKAEQDEDKITLSTMHGSKGLEFKVVWIIGANEGIIPHEKSTKPQQLEEERRLFYVGMTRAKEFLYVSTLEYRYEQEAAASRFIDEMGLDESKIKIGDCVEHKLYGKGVVENKINTMLYIKFKQKHRKIDIDVALKKKLIKKIEEEL